MNISYFYFTIVNMVTKGKRIIKLKESINKEWSQYFFKFIKDNPMQNWNWYYISWNPNITMEIIRDNPIQNWNLFGISNNQN